MNNSTANENIGSQTVLNQLVIEYLREQKRKRRTRLIMRVILLSLILLAAFCLFSLSEEDKNLRAKPHVGLVDINGTISDSQSSSSENLAKSLDEAYDSAGLKAVILRINSPGGSPVQADYMYNTVQYYRKKYPDVRLYAVCVDTCASAAYYIASAAEEIYANPSSLVGSIGVLYNGFGFVDAMQKLGITRRLQTAGANKGFLDPFSTPSPNQTQRLQTMLDEIHQVFIARVKEGRGDRLKIDELTFSGLFWTGIQAKERGLIDGFASSGQLMREVIHLDKVVDYTYKPNVLERVAKNIGASMVAELPAALGAKSGITLDAMG
ncbi:MAG: S49 family peptidase [Tatlockia sp.]|jgi:protease-4